MVTTPEHGVRWPTRWRSRRRRSREEERRGRRRHRSDREEAGDSAAEAPPPASPEKKPRVRSEVGLVRGCAWRFEPFGAPAAVAHASKSSAAAPASADNCDGMVFAPEPAPPPKAGAGAASSSSLAAPPPPAPTTGVLFACQVSLPPPPPRPLSTQATRPQPLFFAGAGAAPPLLPASTACPMRTKVMGMAIPSTSRQPYAAAIPAIPPFPTVAPPPQHPDADADELRRAKVQRYAGLIAKKQQETAERYGKLLRSGQAPPPPPPPPPEPAADKEALRRIAAARWRFRGALAQLERKAKEAALFVQMAPLVQLRELGIDQDMERIVSPDRPRDGNGAPVVSPEHPCSPVEKLGFFLKADE